MIIRHIVSDENLGNCHTTEKIKGEKAFNYFTIMKQYLKNYL